MERREHPPECPCDMCAWERGALDRMMGGGAEARPPTPPATAETVNTPTGTTLTFNGLEATMRQALARLIDRGVLHINGQQFPITSAHFNYVPSPVKWEDCIGLGVVVDRPDIWKWFGDHADAYVLDTQDMLVSPIANRIAGGHRYAVLIRPGLLELTHQRMGTRNAEEIAARFVFAFIHKHDRV